MTISEKSAYLKGLMDGLSLNQETAEGKMIAAIVDLLGDLSKKVTDIEETTIAISDELDGKVMQVIEFQHVKPGKGAAFVRVKMKNVITGGVTETSLNPSAKFPTAFIERKKMEYSYNDGALYYFMDQETYELEPIDGSNLDDSFKFVKENDVCTVMSYKGKVFGVEVPNFVDLVVTETEPGFAGNTATNVTKPATVETGAEVKVPLFINEGDKIQIDTRTGEYLGRSKA